jgi:urate oxidase
MNNNNRRAANVREFERVQRLISDTPELQDIVKYSVEGTRLYNTTDAEYTTLLETGAGRFAYSTQVLLMLRVRLSQRITASQC